MNCRKFLRITIAIILVSFVFLGSGGKESEFDWPRWRGPSGDGISLETNWNPQALAGGPNILWKSNIGTGNANVIIKDDLLFAIGVHRFSVTVMCLNAVTGQEIWRYIIDDDVGIKDANSTPITDGDFVYAISNQGVLVCLKAKNGKPRWRRDLVSEYDVTEPYYEFAASPVIEGDLLILTANNSGMAIDKRTGEVVWISDNPPEEVMDLGPSTGPDYSTPVMYDYDGARYSLISNYEGLHSAEVSTGNVLWTHPWDPFRAAHCTEPIIFDGKVFITRYKGAGSVLLDIKAGTPKVLWKNGNLSSDFSSPVLIDGFIYGCDGGAATAGAGRSTLRCLDVLTGEIMWENDLRGEGASGRKMVTASLIAADGKLLILKHDGILHIAEANPSSYREISRCDVFDGKQKFRMFWTHPVLCNGRIYCRNYAGDLVCIDVSQ
jgi:outer membrane protein assembly factor BamB